MNRRNFLGRLGGSALATLVLKNVAAPEPRSTFTVAPSGSVDSPITWTDAVTVSNNGNVGIRTTDPERWEVK